MKVLYIWDADYPWDIRVEKICNALMQDGHEVHIASRNLKKNNVYENILGLHIHRIAPWQNNRLNYFFSFPLFFSPIWKRFLDAIILDHKIDLIIVRDLPLAIAGIWAGKRHGIPVVLDMAEDYVAMIRDIWKARKFHGFNLVVRNPYFAKLVETYAFKRMDHILVVVDEASEVVYQGGGSPSRVTVVSNTPDLEGFEKGRRRSGDEITRIKSHYSAIYTGGIQLGRGLQLVLEAIPTIINIIPDFRLVVVGDGYATNAIKSLIRDLAVDEYVIWIGWVPHAELGAHLAASKIGIIPHFTSDHVNTTIPNKIFDYMAMGLPVVASNSPPMKRIIEQVKCGRVFESGNVDDLANSIIEMYDNSADCGDNGRGAVKSIYNWSEDKKRLLSVINSFSDYPGTI